MSRRPIFDRLPAPAKAVVLAGVFAGSLVAAAAEELRALRSR